MEVNTEIRTTNPAGSPKLTPRESHDKTPFESFEDLTSKLLKVPKEEMNERRIERKEARKRK